MVNWQIVFKAIFNLLFVIHLPSDNCIICNVYMANVFTGGNYKIFWFLINKTCLACVALVKTSSCSYKLYDNAQWEL